MTSQVKSDQIFRQCVEDSYDAIMVTDRNGVTFFVNRAFEQMYGYTRQEAVGNTPRLVRSPHQGKDFYERMWRDILDPKIGFWKGELINRAKDGTEVPVLLTITPFKDDDDFIQGFMSIALDIREKKQLEAQLLHQDRLASIGLLASGLAHEIGTPLGVIRGRAEYLKFNPQQVDLKSVDVIVNQIDRISKLIYSLLNLARAGKSEIAVSVQLTSVVNEVLGLVGQQFRKNSISFSCSIDSSVRVKAELERLEQVLLNLLINAIHAIETAIALGRNDGHCIEMGALEKRGMWELTIKDSGCGISKENMGHLFKPFFTTKEVGSGTGLGLVICQQIVGSWGGKLLVDSKEGVGSLFRLLLPKG